MIRRRSLSLLLLAGLVVETGVIPVVLADPPTAAAVKEAGKHFDRGVSLYTEADYKAALVEFRRAYELAPNSSVLYNIGETYYQLQNYASALTTLQRYLNESGAGAQHRREVEQTLNTLQSRVGKVMVTTNLADCDVMIDDAPAGRTPLSEPIIVSIGSRKITVTHPGTGADNRTIDVAAGDTVQVSVNLTEAAVASSSVSGTAGLGVAAQPDKPKDRHALIMGGWITTGVLGAAAIATGTVAIVSSHQLGNLRNEFPVMQKDLDDKGSRVKTFSAVADITGALAIIAGGITLTLQLTNNKEHETHLAIAPNGVQLAGSWR